VHVSANIGASGIMVDVLVVHEVCVDLTVPLCICLGQIRAILTAMVRLRPRYDEPDDRYQHVLEA
jgi:hypothetical protein